MIETDVIPPDYTPGMLRLDAKLVYDDKGFCADIVNLIVKGKIHLEDQSDKNQQILIRVNEGATRNNAVLLPAEQLLLEALFRKAMVALTYKPHAGCRWRQPMNHSPYVQQIQPPGSGDCSIFKSRLATLALPITATISATCALSVFAISLASAQVI